MENVQESATLSLLRVVLEKKTKHEGFPDFVRAEGGDEIGVRTTRVVAKQLAVKAGDNIEGLVRAAGGGLYYFDPDSVKVCE